MSRSARRLLLSWLLLLLPTLGVALGAFQLLRREQARLAEQEASAWEARRAAAANRAGLIVENIELLIGDVQAGLLETLAGMPSARLDDELALWERNNPLVRAAFRCAADGRLAYPPAAAMDDEARGFRRRLAPLLEGDPPWRRSAAKAKAEASEPPAFAMEGRAAQQRDGAGLETRPEPVPATDEGLLARQQAMANISQVQSARRDAVAVSKSRDYLAELADAPSAAAERLAANEVAAGDRFAEADAAGQRKRAEYRAAAEPDREGWTPWLADGRLHLIGWIERPSEGEVRGVEIELAALIARLAATLPAETAAGEGYALSDDRGRILHQVGSVPRAGAPAVTLPLFSDALPGWEVLAFLEAPASPDGAGSGFFFAGSLLTGLLVVAILCGGALLVGQARRSEAEAAQKTSFVANVSHEFKTPLTTIRLYAELLEQDRVADAARRREYLQTIGRETQRLARLVGNALDFSRLEQGRKKYERIALDARAELAQLLDTHAPRLAEAGLALRRELPEAPLPLTTDRDAFAQVLLNLLDNAAKYAAAGEEVTVALAPRAGGGAVVRVADRGPGVPGDHRDRIFEKFHRVDDTLTAEQGGAGLGLSIARQLARGLGGDLRHEPRAGGGAVFVFDLP